MVATVFVNLKFFSESCPDLTQRDVRHCIVHNNRKTFGEQDKTATTNFYPLLICFHCSVNIEIFSAIFTLFIFNPLYYCLSPQKSSLKTNTIPIVFHLQHLAYLLESMKPSVSILYNSLMFVSCGF